MIIFLNMYSYDCSLERRNFDQRNIIQKSYTYNVYNVYTMYIQCIQCIYTYMYINIYLIQKSKSAISLGVVQKVESNLITGVVASISRSKMMVIAFPSPFAWIFIFLFTGAGVTIVSIVWERLILLVLFLRTCPWQHQWIFLKVAVIQLLTNILTIWPVACVLFFELNLAI